MVHNPDFSDSATRPVKAPGNKAFSSLLFLKQYLVDYKKEMAFAAFSLVGAFISLLILGQAIKHLIDFPPLDGMGERHLKGIFLLCSAAVVLALSSYGRSYYVSWLGEVVLTSLRKKIFEKLLSLEVAFYESRRPGELLDRVQNDTLLVQVLVGTSLAVMVRNVFFFVGGLSMMLVSSYGLTAVMMAVVPVIIIPSKILGKRVKELSKKALEANSILSGHIEESISFVKTLQAFTQEKAELDRFERLSQQSLSFQTKRIKARATLAFFVISLVLLTLSAVLYTGSYWVQQGHLTSGTFASFLFYTVLVATSGASLSELSADFQRAAGACERIQELLMLEPAIKQPSLPKVPKTGARGTLALHRVTFSYAGGKNQVCLKEVSLSVAPGEKVALVGPSGSGKSTLFNLILRFYDPQAGTIHFNGVPLKETDLSYLREKISWVAQEPSLFSTTLLDNIRYGCSGASPQEIEQACEASHLSDVINALPEGLYTQVGVKGVKLSGGQKQRVSLARAFLKKPQLLLLDEATSSLDSISESYVQKGLSKLMARSSCLIIAHRLSTVIQCDKIVVLDKGSIIDVGTHGELLNRCDLYKQLSSRQFYLPV